MGVELDNLMPLFRQRESLDYFLASVINNKADKSECLPSCKLIREDQGELEEGRNRFWHRKDREL